MSAVNPPPSQQPKSALFSASDYAQDGKHHLLLAATGSVATIKLPLIAKTLALHHHPRLSIRILITASATHFLQSQSSEQPSLSSLLAIPGVDGIHLDQDEWAKPWLRGDAILHIELRRWAHVLLIAPLSANSLAKIANGLSDGLLMSVVRAWDTTGFIDPLVDSANFDGTEKKTKAKKQIFVAPAMNTAMWRHPITEKQLGILEDEWGAVDHSEDEDYCQRDPRDGWITVLRPVEKELACGDVGDGAMMEWREIVARIQTHLGLLSEEQKTEEQRTEG